MKQFAYLLVISMLVLVYPVASEARTKSKSVPYVVKDVPGTDSCVEGDPYGPCRGRVVYVKNPSKTKTFYTRVGCGYPHLQAVALVRPGKTAVYDFLWGGPGSLLKGMCRIENTVHYKRHRLPTYRIKATKVAKS
jgi:hypothetical protein